MHSEHISHDSIKPISALNLTYIGDVCKPHGLAGEFTADIDVDLSPLVGDEEDPLFLFVESDGLKVPYKLDGYRNKGKLSLLKFEGVDSEEEADRLSNLKIYLESEYLADDDEADLLSLCEGYLLRDQNHNPVGVIENVDQSTANYLIEVRLDKDGSTALLPAAEELIIDIDHITKTLYLTIPDGILSL